MSVFVTVGTTFFEDLVENVTSKNVIQMMQEFGYSSLIIQYGRGKFPVLPDSNNFPCETLDYKSSITKYISDAALVISHAGAGSCLEVLAAGKPLIVVINEKLMDNHQHELAEQLNKDGHLLYCTPSTLVKAIKSIQMTKLLPFPPARAEKFAIFMDSYFSVT